MADSQDSSPQPQAAPAQSPDSPPSSPHQAPREAEFSLSDETGSGDEIADALASIGESEDSEKVETGATAREGSERRTESQQEPTVTPASKDTDRVKPSALASFHRQQKELFSAQQEFKAQKTEYDRMMGIIENAKSDRLAALELMGYTNTQEFLQSIAEDGGRETPERTQLRELQKWKAAQEKERQDAIERQQEQTQQAQQKAQLDAIEAQVQNTLKSDRYREGLLSLAGTDANVMAQMDRMAAATGEIPKVEDAISAVEAQYRSYLEEMAGNPEVVRFFSEKLRQTKSPSDGTPQSKTRATPQTIGSEARGPGTRLSGNSADPSDDDARMAEALNWLKSTSV